MCSSDLPLAWKYCRLRVKVHAHNYAQVVAKPSETFYLDKPDKYRSTEITLLDPLSVKAGQKGNVQFPKGTRYWFLVEVFPDDSRPADDVTRIEQGPVVGFTLREPERSVAVLHNPTDQAAQAAPSGLSASGKAVLYDDVAGKGKPLDRLPAQIRVPAQRHVVVVNVR